MIKTSKAKSNFVKLREINFHYLTWGNPENTPLILLHGFMDHSYTFEFLAEYLSDQYYLIAWDARGFGRTDWIHRSGYYHFFDYIYDLELFLEFLNLEKVTLIGHSMGGMISSLYSGIYPQKVEKLVNMEGWMVKEYEFSTAPEKVKDWINDLKKDPVFKPMDSLEIASKKLQMVDNRMSEEVASFLAYNGTKEQNGKFIWRHDPLHKTTSPQQTYFKQIEVFWNRIDCPTLLLQGEDKNIFEIKNFSQRIESFKNAKHVVIKNSGHNLHFHQPKKISDIIKKFIIN